MPYFYSVKNGPTRNREDQVAGCFQIQSTKELTEKARVTKKKQEDEALLPPTKEKSMRIPHQRERRCGNRSGIRK